MEVDCTSSASNDSNPTHFHQTIGQNYYADNTYFTNVKRTEYEYFNKDFYITDKNVAEKDKNKDCYSKKDYENLNNNNNNNNNNHNSSEKSHSDLFLKKNFIYNGTFNKSKDYVDNTKNNIEYFNNKKNDSNFIHLNNIDGFGKKSMSFSADQVSYL